jgi:S-adenosylmethionine hydrolase
LTKKKNKILPPQMHSVITLTTDFGIADEYVGVMKGVIAANAPGAIVIDLTHNISSQAVREAAFLLAASYRYFPKGTVHVVVVDPGVGSDRKIVVLRADGHLFVAPDNGILTLLLTDKKFEAAYEVTNNALFHKPVSNTFHGRDIMAPVAARLASGLAVADVGPLLERGTLVKLTLPVPTIDDDRQAIDGEVIGVDKFGNLLTNIHVNDISSLAGLDRKGKIAVTVKAGFCNGLHNAYGEVAVGSPVAIIGSREYLEVSVNRGSAAELLQAGCGDAVSVALLPGGRNET